MHTTTPFASITFYFAFCRNREVDVKYFAWKEPLCLSEGETTMTRLNAKLLWVLCCSAISMIAQTQLDLRSQSKAVDFQTAPFTKPLKTGSVLPVTCTLGELFFPTTAGPGNNIYACVSTNTWVVQTGGGAGSATIQNSGVTVGTRPILNLSNGAGVLLATSDTGQSISVQSGLDTSVALTKAAEQSGETLLCSSSSGSGTTYTCSMLPILATYSSGMVLHWIPDVDGLGGPTTLNVDSLGAIPVKLADGVTDPAPGDLVANQMVGVTYNDSIFLLISRLFPAGILGEAQPTCSAAVRGRLWFVAGSSGNKDSLSVCAKDNLNAYAWRIVY